MAGRRPVLHPLTGPEPISGRDQVRLLGAALGREIGITEIPAEAARQRMIRAGTPDRVTNAVPRHPARRPHRPRRASAAYRPPAHRPSGAAVQRVGNAAPRRVLMSPGA